ncbi:MAG: SPASM domain-containing protein [Patescibacteria group bacterium]
MSKKYKTGKIEPYFGSLTQTSSQIKNPESFCSCNVLEDDKIAEGMVFLYTEAKRRGFPVLEFFSLGPCMTVAEGAGVIAPDGMIYKCLNMIGLPHLAVGDIYSEQPKPAYYDFMTASRLNYCLYQTNCSFVSECGGGCDMECFLKNGDYNKLVCHRQRYLLIINS